MNEFNSDKCSIKLLNSELIKENKKEYKKIVDMYVAIDDRIFVEIEINRELFKDVKMRNYVYADKIYTMLLEQGENPEELKEKTFIQFNLNAKDKDVPKGDAIIVPYDLVSKDVYIKNKIIILKYLEYYRTLFYNKNNLSHSEIWLASFTVRNFAELYDMLGYIMNDEKRDKYIRKVIKLSKDNFILHEWEKEKMDKLVEYERRSNALEEGMELGITQKNIEIVKNMLKEKYEIKEIMKITGLNEEEIMKIKASL